MQLNKLKSGIKNDTTVTFKLSSNIICDNETNFLHKLWLTIAQVSKIRKAFANGSTASIKLSNTQLLKMLQLGGFLPLKFMLNLNKVTFGGSKKAQNLTKKKSDDNVINLTSLAKVFKKESGR